MIVVFLFCHFWNPGTLQVRARLNCSRHQMERMRTRLNCSRHQIERLWKLFWDCEGPLGQRSDGKFVAYCRSFDVLMWLRDMKSLCVKSLCEKLLLECPYGGCLLEKYFLEDLSEKAFWRSSYEKASFEKFLVESPILTRPFWRADHFYCRCIRWWYCTICNPICLILTRWRGANHLCSGCFHRNSFLLGSKLPNSIRFLLAFDHNSGFQNIVATWHQSKLLLFANGIRTFFCFPGQVCSCWFQFCTR